MLLFIVLIAVVIIMYYPHVSYWIYEWRHSKRIKDERPANDAERLEVWQKRVAERAERERKAEERREERKRYYDGYDD